ncbi:hypothetical protein DFP72DRAFT_1080378 [Ephemerocybe angulata]|uniref:Uncharacterized protein n=1 Tax=Ephemerocybe angulata TaxID=980116 RepID=A0A8H6HAA9_9AGAR|nr:hypothetical protein DFP72DRAFT_1080378 [Tulosesus angulatus]
MPVAASARRKLHAPVRLSTARSRSHTRTRPNPLHPPPRTALNLTHSHDARGNGAKTKMAIRGPLRSRSRQPSLPCHQTPRSNDRTRQVPPSKRPPLPSLIAAPRTASKTPAQSRAPSAKLYATCKPPDHAHRSKVLGHYDEPGPIYDHHISSCTQPPFHCKISITPENSTQSLCTYILAQPSNLPTADNARGDRANIQDGPRTKLGYSTTKTHTTSSSPTPNQRDAPPARVVDPTPPQRPSTMADRRKSAVAGLTAIKPHVARKAPEHSNLPPMICPRSRRIQSAYMRSTTDASPQSNTWELKSESTTAGKKTSTTFQRPPTSAPQSPANRVRCAKTAFRATQKSGQPANHTHRRQSPTRFHHRRRELRDLHRYDDYDTGHLSPHHAFDPGLAGRPMKGKCARREVRYLGYQRLMKSNEATAKTTAFGMRGFEAIQRRLRQCQKLQQAVLDARRKPFAAGRPRRRTTLEATADGTGHWDGRRRRLSLLQPNSCEAEMERDDPADTSDHTSDPPRRHAQQRQNPAHTPPPKHDSRSTKEQNLAH